MASETRDWEGFVREMFDAPDRGDWDGGEIQEVAVKHGVLREVTVTEPCDPEGCACAEYGEFPLTCYRLAPKSAAPRETPVDGLVAEMAKQAALGHKMFCVGVHEADGFAPEPEWVEWPEAFANLLRQHADALAAPRETEPSEAMIDAAMREDGFNYAAMQNDDLVTQTREWYRRILSAALRASNGGAD